jgi:ribosomal protein S18 acetylase RimI-like enzyme
MNIRAITRRELAGAATLLSRSMRDNPVNVAAFGGSAGQRQSAMAAFFIPVLEGLFGRGLILGAFDGVTLEGICGMVRPGECRPGALEKVRILGSLLIHASPRVAVRVGRWAGEWAKHDPGTRHWHLGPIAVDSHRQGKGIGSAMLRECCGQIDCENVAAYLETDKPENLRFCQKHDFVVAGQSVVLGQASWYMLRQAARSSSSRV